MMQRISIAFVDGTGLCTSEEDHEEKMKQIMGECTNFHEATGSKMQ